VIEPSQIPLPRITLQVSDLQSASFHRLDWQHLPAPRSWRGHSGVYKPPEGALSAQERAGSPSAKSWAPRQSPCPALVSTPHTAPTRNGYREEVTRVGDTTGTPITLLGAMLTASRQTNALAHSGGDARGPCRASNTLCDVGRGGLIPHARRRGARGSTGICARGSTESSRRWSGPATG
jgi:hypothetical protein